MGVAYTIDSPLKVSQYGIDSVISLVDNVLLEKLRQVYSEKFDLPYREITEKAEDYIAERITSYLNLIHRLATEKFEELKENFEEKKAEVIKYFEMLPDASELKKEFFDRLNNSETVEEIKNWVKEHLVQGSIDVNIMTKVDKTNYKNGEPLPQEFNDAHAALRGYAKSDLTSSLVLSAGMSPRLYGYIERFDDFYPDENGFIKKKIILKVSDYRSALIQGKFLAKKGIWVSEYRIESGLNCGGHAFATDGYLMGPILEEFKNNRKTLQEEVFGILKNALENKGKPVPREMLPLRVTAQGGVGTHAEHEFLLEYYEVDSVGWGSPFLLVPEVTTVDDYTINELAKAEEKDLYLSNISPLGVPFNSLRTASATIKKLEKADKGRPGSSCPKAYLVSNTEFTEKPVCTASRQYQYLKLKELEKLNLPEDEYKKQYEKIIAPECLCVGLAEPAIIVHQIDYKVKDMGVTVCPGPNMAYFNKIVSLKEMINHIYGRTDLIGKRYRPNMFVKELNLYIDYLKGKLDEVKNGLDKRQVKYFEKFAENLDSGVQYYKDLFSNVKGKLAAKKDEILSDLEQGKRKIHKLFQRIESLPLK
jgi:hypothetical protein